MPSFKHAAIALASWVPCAVLGSLLPVDSGLGLQRRQTVTNVGPNCGNTATTRSAWCPGFDINTDYDLTAPSTGVTVAYDFHIARGPCNPDGHGVKTCTLVNGQYPGPTINAKWGDTIQVTVHNDLNDNGTSIHFHGIRQLNSNPNDGTNGVTECPVAPASSKVYTFLATQHGTGWYHSHHSAQTTDGVAGTIRIDGPASANYDTDLGIVPITDWHYGNTWALLSQAIHNGGIPPSPETVVVNGVMKNVAGGGSYSSIAVTAGKTYRLRFVNMATQHHFVVSIDNHPMTIIAVDFVPTQPKTGVTQVTLGEGQRVDVIFTANQAANNYWIRVKPGCGPGGVADVYNSPQYSSGSIVPGAILHYSTAGTGNPTSTAYTVSQTCNDEVVTMKWARSVASSTAVSKLNVTLGTVQRIPGDTLIAWNVNNSPMQADWKNPTLKQVIAGTTTFPASMNLYPINGGATTWTYWVIQWTGVGGPPIPHPIHLHGHNFFVLGAGSGTFSASTPLNFANPVRRDTAMLPPNGYLVVAFLLDNPGAWLMHCHIAWHVSEGMSLQFLERRSEIQTKIPAAQFTAMTSNCNTWTTWYNSAARIYAEEDSGL